MSLLGTLEQFRLPNVLQRIESHKKTGLLVVRQGGLWVEFYVRNGCLLCIGPVRTSATLGDRLVQDKLVSQQIWQEVRSHLGNDVQREMRVAIALMERGGVTREQLRAWTTEKSLTVLNAILSWTSGEIYFEENTQPPADRLLVSLSIASLLEAANMPIASPQTQPLSPFSAPSSPVNFKEDSPSFSSTPAPHTSAATPPASSLSFGQPAPAKPNADIAHVPTLTEAEQFFTETASSETEALAPLFNGTSDSAASFPNTSEISFASLASVDDFSAAPSSIQPELVKYPTPPKRIDTSFMQPAMVLVPADLSAFREQNPKVQVTPDQWRILACVDGCNSLQMTCQLLGLSPDVVCGLAGELVAEGLIYVVPPEQVHTEEPASNTRDLSVPGLANAYVAPGYAASSANPWSAPVPAVSSADVLPNTSTSLSFETESQWGNGGNGATFIPGRGWVTAPQPMQPLYSQGPLAPSSGVYAGSRS